MADIAKLVDQLSELTVLEAAELAASGESLLDTTDEGRDVKREKIDVLEFEYFGAGTTRKKYHAVEGLLRRLLRPVGVIVRA